MSASETRKRTLRRVSERDSILENVWVEEVLGYHFVISQESEELRDKKAFVFGGVGYAIVDLKLDGCVFIQDPLQWFKGGIDGTPLQPVPTPPGLRISRVSDTRIVVRSENFGTELKEYHFWIVVYDAHKNQVRDVDPGIIFEPYQPPDE